MAASSSQDMVTAIFLQQEARRDEERKLDWERRQEQERKWQEMERQNREQHLMTMSIISKALLPGVPPVHFDPDSEVVHSKPSTSKTTGQFVCHSKNDKPDSIQLKYNIWDPPDYLYDTCSDHEGLDDGSRTGSPDKTTIDPYTSGFEQSDGDSDDFDFEDWVNEQFRICKAIQDSYQYDDKKQ